MTDSENDAPNPSENEEEEEDGIEWTNQLSKELLKPIRRKFRKRRVFTPGVDAIWAVDTADISKFSRSNKGYKYLLCVIDTFSKYSYLIPMKTKTGKETAKAFGNLFKTEKRHPKRIWVDKGTEYWNVDVKNVLKNTT